MDEHGLVCSRHEVLPNGCCRIEQTQQNKERAAVTKRERYSCKTCNLQGCCTIYEYCVSCCLNPNKVNQVILKIAFICSIYNSSIYSSIYIVVYITVYIIVYIIVVICNIYICNIYVYLIYIYHLYFFGRESNG